MAQSNCRNLANCPPTNKKERAKKLRGLSCQGFAVVFPFQAMIFVSTGFIIGYLVVQSNCRNLANRPPTNRKEQAKKGFILGYLMAQSNCRNLASRAPTNKREHAKKLWVSFPVRASLWSFPFRLLPQMVFGHAENRWYLGHTDLNTASLRGLSCQGFIPPRGSFPFRLLPLAVFSPTAHIGR